MALRQGLIDAGVLQAKEGPLAMVIALRLDPARRSWWNAWKPAGDALGPILGEPSSGNPFHPADDRIVSLELHFSPAPGLNNQTQVGIWWKEVDIDADPNS